MIINLVPDFLAILNSSDRVAAYHAYFDRHRALLSAYWDNYVLDPQGPHFEEVVRATCAASRDDLLAMLDRTDLVTLARQTEERIQFELGVIEKMGFAGYFLIVSDFIRAGKEIGVFVGPGRGSGAGSSGRW